MKCEEYPDMGGGGGVGGWEWSEGLGTSIHKLYGTCRPLRYGFSFVRS